MDVLLNLLIVVLVLGAIFWVIQYMGLPEPFAAVAKIIILIAFIVFLVSLLGGGWAWPRLRT